MKQIPVIVTLALILGIGLKDRFPRLYTFQPSQVIVQAEEPIKRPLTDTEIIANSKHPEQIMVIYTLESTQGKNDGCKRQGKFNGFGYRQNTREFHCFDTFQEAVDAVDQWLTNKDATNYCLYNEGVARNDCPYAKTALRLLEK